MIEFNLIQQYFSPQLKKALLGGGDDCALLQLPEGLQLAVSSDMLVSGQHFFSNTDPYFLGRKALAVNLSDLAACGATPFAFTLALSLPVVNSDWLDAFSKGLLAMAAEFECELVGGDTTRGPLNICITVMGSLKASQAFLRSNARVGDDIYVSGTLGDARLALRALSGELNLPSLEFSFCEQRLLNPTPRVALGLALHGLVSCALDVSDGLMGDLRHILAASKVGATLDTDALLSCIKTPLSVFSAPLDALETVLVGGDDYELLFTAAPHDAHLVKEASIQSATPVTRIGTITEDLKLTLTGSFQDFSLNNVASFNHFRSESPS